MRAATRMVRTNLGYAGAAASVGLALLLTHGTITIHSRDSAGGALEIAVSDTGPGISADSISRIFQPFEQGEDAVTRRFGGLGLGLAISKMLTEEHGGSIW